jgi:Flp pilus assembly protein TadG
MLRRRHQNTGNVAVTAAFLAVPLLAAVGFAVDLTAINHQKALMQAAADAGALAGAREGSVAFRGTDGVATTAETVALTNLGTSAGELAASFDATVDATGSTVTVTGTAHQPSLLLGRGDTLITVTATAQTLQEMPLCVLQTSEINSSGVKMSDRATIRAPGCLVHANTNIEASDNARLEAGTIQVSGDAKGTMFPTPNIGALTIQDPFDGMDLNITHTCPQNLPDVHYKGNVRIVMPPTIYCGKIVIDGNVEIVFLPGEHYFLGSLDIKGNTKLTGDDVVLIFDNDDSFILAENAEVRLRGRRSGQFAGFVIATTRTNQNKFMIGATRVRELLGTIYIPSAELEVTGSSTVAEDSAWSVIVADSLTMKESPTLVINRNYTASNVPVPNGVGPSNGAPRLVD